MNRPNIVVVDGYCLNPGDLSWEQLKQLGCCTIHERTSAVELIDRLQDAELVLTNKVALNRQTISRLPRLKYIGVTATGYNIIDIDAARDRGIVVTNVPTYGTASVAQMVFAHVLNLTQRVADHAAAVRQGQWAKSSDWCFWNYPLLELSGMTMGIVGYGRIGQATAQLARAFGMHVIAHNRSPIRTIEPVRAVDLETLFRKSDVVSLHCPLSSDTRHLVSRERLALMKKTAILINTSRGPLVDESALADALNEGSLAGAGLDVMEVEPPTSTSPLYSAKNCFITPHIAWATTASRQRLLNLAIENVDQYLQGKPQNVVNAP